MGFPGSSVSKETACIAEGPGLVPGSGRSLGEGRGNPLQYSCLENPMDREACWAPVHGVTRVRHDLATKPPLVLDATEYLIVTLPQSPLTCDSSVLSCLSCHWQFLMRAGELFSRLSFNLNLLGGFFFFPHDYIEVQRRQRHPTPVLLPGKSHGWRSLVGCSPWGH